jgi:hypothetical protein
LAFYTLEVLIKAYVLKPVIPPETVILGSLTSPEFYLFAFFMFPDPGTSPRTPREQVGAAAAVVAIDSFLQLWYLPFSLFLALFTFSTCRLVWLHARDMWNKPVTFSGFMGWSRRLAVVSTLLFAGFLVHVSALGSQDVTPLFQFVKIDNAEANIHYHGTPGEILTQVDGRASGIGGWLLSAGDSVAVADVDGDGLQDIFLTNPLRNPSDRVALYLNKGNYKFERVPLPELSEIFANPAKSGIASGALFFDWNNDGAQDLVVLADYGPIRFFENQLAKTGKLAFVDVTDQMQTDGNATSFTANALDITRSGRLDLIVGNLQIPWLRDYGKRVANNIFNLPAPEYPGDRRMLNSMPESLYNAANGGGVVIYRNLNGRFEKANERDMGFLEQRFSLAIGTGDINNDGWTDLYIANDYGPDQLMLNNGDGTFRKMEGTFANQVGRDNYRGMNASLGDLRNSGNLDIYVSNVHVPLVREGSLLWINNNVKSASDIDLLLEQATPMQAVNEDAFGWGAAMGDLDLDGYLDIVQANGYISNRYEAPGKECPKASWATTAAYVHLLMSADARPESLTYLDNWHDLRGLCLYAGQQNKVYLNRGGRYFVNVADKVGLTQQGESRGVALVDLTNSGKLDAIVANQYDEVAIYRNELKTPRNWAGLVLEGNGMTCNRDAAGSRVTVRYRVDGKTIQQTREVQITNGFAAQGDRRLLFGFGDYSGEVSGQIVWCGQTKQEITLSNNKYIKIVQR